MERLFHKITPQKYFQDILCLKISANAHKKAFLMHILTQRTKNVKKTNFCVLYQMYPYGLQRVNTVFTLLSYCDIICVVL